MMVWHLFTNKKITFNHMMKKLLTLNETNQMIRIKLYIIINLIKSIFAFLFSCKEFCKFFRAACCVVLSNIG